MTRYLWILLTLGLLGGWHWWTHDRAVSRPAGVLVDAEPVQRNLESSPPLVERGYTFIRRAHYDINARVLRKETYYIDGVANLAPVDLAVGWGPMSDTAIIDQLDISQMGRFFYWRPKNSRVFPLSSETLITHAAQMHLIPASTKIEHRLARLRPGQLVTIGGYLVDVRGPGGFVWNTSLSRTDTGDGACEIVWVESLNVD
jgi:hypothetical protein